MAVFETWLKSDLKKPLTVKPLPGNLFSADNQGNLIGVEVMDGGSPAVLSGDVTGYVIRADGATLPISGTLDGNRASIVLPASAYAVIGHISIVIKVGTTTVGACTSYVYQTTTDTIVDPGQVLPSIADLLAQIEAAVATIPASWAGLMADIAPTYSDADVYPVGAYVYYNGDLYRCTTAITTAESWTAGHWTKAALGNDVTDLKSAISENTKNLLVSQTKEVTVVGVAVSPDGRGRFKLSGTANSNGGRTTNVSGLFTLPAGTYTLSANATATLEQCTLWINKSNNVDVVGVTPNGTPSTFTLAEPTSVYIGFGLGNGKAYNATIEGQIEIGNSATAFVPSISAVDYFARTDADNNSVRVNALEEKVNGIKIEQIAFTKNTNNVFNGQFEPNIRINASGDIVNEISPNISAEMEYIPVEASTSYCFYEKEQINYSGTFNVVISYYRADKTFVSQEQKANSGVVRFTTPSDSAFVRFYLWRQNIGDYLGSWLFVVCKGNSPLSNYAPYKVIDYDYVEHKADENYNQLQGKTALIFGDSITDCCNITVNANNETTAYSFRNPSNSYVNAGGNIVNFSMWPKILLQNKQFAEIRNYAKFGATYKDGTPSAGNERQNVSYQITVAENDIANPNGAFPTTGNFNPDIIIFALGTNDGVPNDTPSSAFAKLVRDSDSTINVTASLANMDRSKFCEAVLWAFLKVKSLFPMAQGYCVTPLQSANRNTIPGLLHDYLKEMAERYNYIVIDGSYTSGITRELNNTDTLGEYLIDGLHPNEKGQNLMSRMIIKSLEMNYMPLDGDGFNAN